MHFKNKSAHFESISQHCVFFNWTLTSTTPTVITNESLFSLALPLWGRRAKMHMKSSERCAICKLIHHVSSAAVSPPTSRTTDPYATSLPSWLPSFTGGGDGALERERVRVRERRRRRQGEVGWTLQQHSPMLLFVVFKHIFTYYFFLYSLSVHNQVVDGSYLLNHAVKYCSSCHNMKL